MLDVHDERRIPLEPEPLPARDRAFHRLMANLRRRDMNVRDQKHAKVVADNRPLREAEAASRAAQPGNAEQLVASALRMVSRVGVK